MTEKPFRICLIATEFPGFGPYGGFGVLTRDIALGLAARGLDVFIAMPRKTGQKPVEQVDGLTIFSYPTPLYVGLGDALPYAGLYRMIDADIYHSQEPSLGTAVAQVAVPHKKHIVTFQDPREIEDWRLEWAPQHPSRLDELRFWFHYQRGVGKAARRAHSRYCQAKYITEKAMRMYKLKEAPGFLPNPLRLSEIWNAKALHPTVCYVGRWDARKRPELFLELAAKFPNVNFVFAGACLNDPAKDDLIRQKCRALKNVEIPGWVNATERAMILDKAWIMVNTSTRECLPVSYLEAGAHKCAILSHCNADDFASGFGFWAERGDLDDYSQGLRFLLEKDRWKILGENAYDYVTQTHEYERVIDQHLHVYRRVLEA